MQAVAGEQKAKCEGTKAGRCKGKSIVKVGVHMSHDSVIHWMAWLFRAALVCGVACGAEAGAEVEKLSNMPLVRDAQPACTVVILSEAEPGWLLTQAAAAVTDRVTRWSGVQLPVVTLKALQRELPKGGLVVLGTLEQLQRFEPSIVPPELPVRTQPLDGHGFACHTTGTHTFVAARSERGVYNGALYLGEFRIDGTRSDLAVTCGTVVRTPHMPGRAAYTLTIWGHEAEYTAADWETIFNSFARDGFDRVYFWVSGHFPSKRFPQTYKCKDDVYDTTEKSAIGSVEDLRRIIRAGHDRGLKMYAGGALGGWCCTYLLTNQEPGTTKTRPKGGYEGKFSLCPSHPKSRQALIDAYEEIIDALPEADGLFIESADEWGGCECQTCLKPVDDKGSTQFGQSQITLIQEIMAAVWRRHGHARLSYTIGYDEHRKDPAYYELIRRMNDPRIEWMEARDSWTFPGMSGREQPAAYFSRQVMRWRQYYGLPLDKLVMDTNRAADSAWYGLVTAFEPGAGTGSFHTRIPYPTDQLPYVMTGFVWREATWEPALSPQQMRQRVHQRFFGREAPVELAGDLWELRDLILQASNGRKLSPEMNEALAKIEQRIQQLNPTAGPKTQETFALMTQAIEGTRKACQAAPP